jgi:hypothetical protein
MKQAPERPFKVLGEAPSMYNFHKLQPTPVITAARSRQDSWASPAEKIRPLEKKLGCKPATPQIIRRSAVKNFFLIFDPIFANYC